MTTIKHVSSESLGNNSTGGGTMGGGGGVNKLGATLPLPGSANAAAYAFKIDDRALPFKTMPERARKARKEVKKRFQHGPLTLKDRDWANSTFIDGSKFSKKFSTNLLSNSAAPFNITANDHLEAQASTVINYGGSRSIVFSKTLLHSKWNNTSKLDRNSIEDSLNAKTEKALENTKKKCQHMSHYSQPWDAEQKFMDTIREDKLNRKKERVQMEQTYRSEALDYIAKLEESKERKSNRTELFSTASFIATIKSPKGNATSKLSTLKGRPLEKYKRHISEVGALDEWEREKSELLQKKKEAEEE